MSPSGLITQGELQQFADRPPGIPWALHRYSSGHVVGREDVRGVQSGFGFSVVLHELQVMNPVPRAGGVFSWKKVCPCTSEVIFQLPGIIEQRGTQPTLQRVHVSCE